ncbi:MAG: PAS domain S-box protein [Azonexus sp.]|nr:PAS domain S-box protein [Azonexus sp.]
MNGHFRAWLRLFLPVALLIGLGAYFYIESQQSARLTAVQANESLNVGMGAAMLDRRTQVLLHDLRYEARISLISADREGRLDVPAMTQRFVELLRSRPVYDQLRWIDSNGQELIRVGLVDGQPAVVARDKLQNKADRYYFTETMKLAPGQVYISPIDLDVENGVVEVPYKLTLRVAMPLVDAAGAKHGMLIFNYLAEEMIAYMEVVTVPVADHLMLLNTAGDLLHAPDPADEWCFNNEQTNNGERRPGLPIRFPDSWARIAEQDHGQFIDAQGLWTFQSVYPLRAGVSSIADIRDQAQSPLSSAEAAHRWLVLSHLAPASLATRVQHDETPIYLSILLMLGLFAAGTALVVRAGVRERQAESHFKVFFERAMVGIGMVSLDCKWLTVNPALCRILGYSAEQMRDKTWADITHPDDLATSITAFNQALQGTIEGYELEKRYLGADGQPVEVSIATQLVRQRNGKPDYFVVVVEDISQRVMAQKQQQKTLETLRRFIDHLPGMAYIKDHETRVLVANRQFQEALSQPPENLLGRLTTEIFPGEIGQKIAADERRIMSAGRAESMIETVGERVFESMKFPIPHGDGPPELGGITLDVTARKQSEQLLEMQAQRATALLALPEKSVELDEAGFMRYVLDQVEALTGSSIGFMHFVNPDEETIELVAWSSKTLDQYCHATFDNHYPISRAGIWADAARQKQPVVINDYTNAANKKGLPAGHSALERLISVPVMEEGQVRMMTGVGNKPGLYTEKDVETVQLLGNEAWRIVRRLRAERALRIANQVVNASPVVCFRWAASESWPVVFVSENVRQWGYTQADLQAGNPPFSALVHPDDLARIVDEMTTKAAAGLAAYEQEYRIVTPENKLIWVVDRTNVRRDAEGKVLFYDGVLTDITDRKIQQLALARNLTEQRELNRRLEEAHSQLLQSEKMASIGQLAAGIAHELNNPIGFVHSNLGTLDGYVRDLMEIIEAYEVLASESTADSAQVVKITQLREARDFNYIREDISQLMHESKDGLGRVRRIVQDLKNFSHVSEQEWQWANLHEGLDSTLNIVWNELKYKCKIVKEYGDLPKVHCMISQLNQVFMNLLVNAGHAIEKQGTITLRTVQIGDAEVCIEISDSGKGIAPEHLTRIFEPFFTTKPVGKGTGLGLSLSYGIINKHNGRIEVDSTLGQGTTFRVIIPINQDAGIVPAPSEASV